MRLPSIFYLLDRPSWKGEELEGVQIPEDIESHEVFSEFPTAKKPRRPGTEPSMGECTENTYKTHMILLAWGQEGDKRLLSSVFSVSAPQPQGNICNRNTCNRQCNSRPRYTTEEHRFENFTLEKMY